MCWSAAVQASDTEGYNATGTPGAANHTALLMVDEKELPGLTYQSVCNNAKAMGASIATAAVSLYAASQWIDN